MPYWSGMDSRSPRPAGPPITQEDFPGVVAATEKLADKELGSGTGKPTARPDEKSRFRAP